MLQGGPGPNVIRAALIASMGFQDSYPATTNADALRERLKGDPLSLRDIEHSQETGRSRYK